MPSPSGSSPIVLEVLIIGGGPCGLATAISVALAGHKATVCEASPPEYQHGSGIQSSPNGTRLFSKWGLYGRLRQVAGAPTLMEIRHFDGRLLARREDYDKETLRQFKFPLWMLHRADLQVNLTQRATELGVKIHHLTRVTKINSGKPYAVLESGERYDGDIIVLADGAWSTLRPHMVQTIAAAQPTGNMAYRITIERAHIRDEKLLEFISLLQIRTWIGPDFYAVGYPLRGGAQLTAMLILPEKHHRERTNVDAVIGEMRDALEGSDPILLSMLDAVQRVNSWSMMHAPHASSWRSTEGKCVLAGDCCHYMTPFLAQGLSLALEDAATLGALLQHVISVEQVPSATNMYERLRAGRALRILEKTSALGQELRLADGMSQVRRDEELKCGMVDKGNWMYPQDWIWSYDAYEEAERAYLSEPY